MSYEIPPTSMTGHHAVLIMDRNGTAFGVMFRTPEDRARAETVYPGHGFTVLGNAISAGVHWHMHDHTYGREGFTASLREAAEIARHRYEHRHGLPHTYRPELRDGPSHREMRGTPSFNSEPAFPGADDTRLVG